MSVQATCDKEYTYHIPPRPLPGPGDVTIKPEGWVFTLRPYRCYEYYFSNNWPSPLGDLATLKFSSIYVTTKIISDVQKHTSTDFEETKFAYIF